MPKIKYAYLSGTFSKCVLGLYIRYCIIVPRSLPAVWVGLGYEDYVNTLHIAFGAMICYDFTDIFIYSVLNEDYTLGGLVSDVNACSLQHLIYWLATMNESTSSGSRGLGNLFEPSGSGGVTNVGSGDVFGSGSGELSSDILGVSITSTVCKPSAEDDTTSVVFPISC